MPIFSELNSEFSILEEIINSHQLALQQLLVPISRSYHKQDKDVHELQAALNNDFYSAYLNLYQDKDSIYQLSALTFGRHIAEMKSNAQYHFNNHYIPEYASYYREDILFSFDKFESPVIKATLEKKYHYKFCEKENDYWMTLTNNLSTNLAYTLKTYFSNIEHPNYITIKFPDDPLSILTCSSSNADDRAEMAETVHTDKIKLDNLRNVIRSAGLRASLWDVAKTSQLPTYTRKNNNNSPCISIVDNLNEKSPPFTALFHLAKQPQASTNILAQAVIKLLLGLETIDVAAFERIKKITAVATKYYQHNYSRFSLYVYSIIHEITLQLNGIVSLEKIEKEFIDFINATKNSTFDILGVDENQLSNSRFVAVPALNGMNSFVAALNLAKELQNKIGEPFKLHLIGHQDVYRGTTYMELPELAANQLAYEIDEANVYSIVCGPVIYKDTAVSPGIDINKFIKKHIIDCSKKSPVTIIADLTSTLYRNLRLDQSVIALIQAQQLNLIFHESGQKFHLIHSDQIQFGRMFAWGAKNILTSSIVESTLALANEDFFTHIDLRVGAYISQHCGKKLEQIKQQHFSNGHTLKKSLERFIAIEDENIYDISLNKNDSFFVCAKAYLEDAEAFTKTPQLEIVKSCFEERDSFGHFNTTYTGIEDRYLRVSAGGSDLLDTLLEVQDVFIQKLIKMDQCNLLSFLKQIYSKFEAIKVLSFTDEFILFGMLKYHTDRKLIYCEPESSEYFSAIARALLPKFTYFNQHSYFKDIKKFFSINDAVINHTQRLTRPSLSTRSSTFWKSANLQLPCGQSMQKQSSCKY